MGIREVQTNSKIKGLKPFQEYIGSLPDGLLRIFVGFELAGKDGRQIWHASFSTMKYDNGNIVVRFRKPTKKEARKALDKIMSEVHMVFKKTRTDPMVLHFWQVED